MAGKKNVRKIYIGVAWPYVNDIFHIGNLAGAYLPPDIFARFHKLRGNRVLMVSGSDFHGTPITLRAEKERKKPEEIATQFHRLDKEYLKKFDIDYTLYTSTHTQNHQHVVQEMFLQLLKKKFIQIKKTEQLYSEQSKKFLQDRYIEGQCPYCNAPDARGDQCEKCGRTLDALELINPISKTDKSNLTRKETENYFLDLTKLQKDVKKWLLPQTSMRAWVKSEALGWIREGLKPRSITRDIDYGVPLPIEKIPKSQRIENITRKKFYVWFEAVVGYLSAAVEYSQKIKKPNYWREFFYNPKGETYYFVGQDNLVFHCINWPAQLIAYDKKINLPTNVFVNKFLLLEGKKMSKSRGWFIETPYLVGQYPIDAVRFYVAFNMPEQKEFNFTWKEFIETNNSILVGTIGNYIHRVAVLAQKNFGSKFYLTPKSVALEVKTRIEKAFEKTENHLNKGEFRSALQAIVDLASFGNAYVDRNQVWKMVKEDPRKAKIVVLAALSLANALGVLLYPFVPESSDRFNYLFGYKKWSSYIREGKDFWHFLSHKGKIELPRHITPVFPKIEETNISKETASLLKLEVNKHRSLLFPRK
ncbi:MAG: Methionyl-tRNA synthetase [Parcubacteria group bacterium Greene0714_21]|nr:MAG: Methionyl-tRNA synthetase [Parcubacteria group bacterium Greene0416_39]TSD04140.1 MAG: Methionyl-tRNA synthetase [Parcubacteria group bacterium Greene0714_21]